MVSRFTTRRIERAEKKAKRKIEQYKKQGINISSKQSPVKFGRKMVDKFRSSSEEEARQYLKELRDFNKRSNRYMRGKDGAAISFDKYREYKKVEAQLRPKYEHWWDEHRSERVIKSGKITEQTVGTEAWMMDSDKKYPYGKTFRSKDISEFKDEKQLDKEIETMMKQLDPEYERVKAQNLKDNMMGVVKTFNEAWLEQVLDELDIDELIELNYRTNLVEEFYLAYNLIMHEQMSGTEIYEYSLILEHMLKTLEQVTNRSYGSIYDYVEFDDDYEVDYNEYDF